MKIMRSNYDKMHRCPNWSGPGFTLKDGDCPSGSLSRQMYGVDGKNKHPEWKFHVCYQCGTVVLPNVLRNLDPTWWKFAGRRAYDNWTDPAQRSYMLRKKKYQVLDLFSRDR